MKVLIIDQCSSSKNIPDGAPVFDAEDIDSSSRESLLERDGVTKRKARNLYTGRQQKYITEAVDVLRNAGHDVDRYFISAGFGLVDELTMLPPYEVTFNDMADEVVRDRATHLGISEAVRRVVSTELAYDVLFFTLGSDYYLSLDIEDLLVGLSNETHVVVFNQEDLAADYENVISIPARTGEAKENGSIVVALKGNYLKNFANHVTAGVAVETLRDVKTYCTIEYPTQSGFDCYE